MFAKRLHVFKSGPQVSANGVERVFSKEDLQEVVDSYDPEVHEAPLVIGHSGDSDSIPSYGWIKKFVRKGEDLYADVDFTDTAKDLVKNGHYKKVSISFYSPESSINPHQGQWSARHLALLGAAPPAVKGLEPFSFSEEEGVFNFAANITPDQLFDKELGPSLLEDKGPLEILKEKLEQIRGDISASLTDLEESQENQKETDVSQEETTPEAGNSAPENPNQQFSEMKKKMGREGAEASQIAQTTANLETMSPEDQYEETTLRKKAKGAHGHEVQVVEEVFEEGEDSLPVEPKKSTKRMKAVPRVANPPEEEEEEEMFAEEDIDSMIEDILNELDSLEEEEEFSEISYKVSEGGKVKFGKRPAAREEDTVGRGLTGRSKDDSYGDRQKVGKGPSDGREETSDDSGEEDEDRVNTGKSSEEDEDRVNTGKSYEGDEEARWADQPEGRSRHTNADQYDADEEGFVRKLGVSDGTEPHGRDGGPTEVSEDMEEEPSEEEIAVPLQSTKRNKVARVLHQSSEDDRQAPKGGPIADHAEGEADGLTREPRKAKVSDGKDARGRDGGTTIFPDLSEEYPDDMELAVDLEDATESDDLRIMLLKMGDMPTTSYKERVKDTFSKTGKGSTYGQKSPQLDDEEEEVERGSEEFCGMGSMGQSRPSGFPSAMYEEFMNLKAENDRLRREYEEHKVKTRKAKIAEFIDSLYVEGKLTDGVIPQGELQHYCEGIEFGTLEYSEGESPTSKLFEMLNRLPNMVYFGEVVANSPVKDEEEEMDPHQKALKMVASGEASDYVKAIKMCLWSDRG